MNDDSTMKLATYVSLISSMLCLSAPAWAQDDTPTDEATPEVVDAHTEDTPTGAEVASEEDASEEVGDEVDALAVEPEEEGSVDMRGAMKRYDFDRGRQMLAGAIGGVTGLGLTVGVVLLGSGVDALVCQRRPGPCRVATGITTNLLAFTTLIATPLVAVNLTGGPRANGWTYTGEVLGFFAGAIAMNIVGSSIISEVTRDGTPNAGSTTLVVATVFTSFAAAGFVSALGYQLFYPGPDPDYVVAPMLVPDGGGLVFGARF